MQTNKQAGVQRYRKLCVLKSQCKRVDGSPSADVALVHEDLGANINCVGFQWWWQQLSSEKGRKVKRTGFRFLTAKSCVELTRQQC